MTKIIKVLLITIMLIIVSFSISAQEADITDYAQKFMNLYKEIHDPANGYFSKSGVPYHSVETMMIEAPDYGHETTSEAISYWIWLESEYGRLTGDWEPLKDAWEKLDQQIIPADALQNTGGGIPTTGEFMPEMNTITDYPNLYYARGNWGWQNYPMITTLRNPIAIELGLKYGRNRVYGMHWQLDCDNWFKFLDNDIWTSDQSTDHENNTFSNKNQYYPVFMDTNTRGMEESAWETIPHPKWDDFSYGTTYSNGYLDLFSKQPNVSKQWRYSTATDADARVIQAMYWANIWNKEQHYVYGLQDTDAQNNTKKMGDYLRYGMFDKHSFKIGEFRDPADSPNQTTAPYYDPSICGGIAGDGEDAVTGKYDNAHYLMGWYYAWGGEAEGAWTWEVGSSHAHFGYQNPMAAWAMGYDSNFYTDTADNCQRDWQESLNRQLDFIRWLQSKDGAIAGGATNMWDGKYLPIPADVPTFYGMGYQQSPVYVGEFPEDTSTTYGNRSNDSNRWIGWQTWCMQRVMELYYTSTDPVIKDKVKIIADKWIEWIFTPGPNGQEKIIINPGSSNYYNIGIADGFTWNGKPGLNWTDTTSFPAAGISYNDSLECEWDPYALDSDRDAISDTDPRKYNWYTKDVGIVASMIRTLTWYAAAVEKNEGSLTGNAFLAKDTAKALLDELWDSERRTGIKGQGIAEEVERPDYFQLFTRKVHIPEYRFSQKDPTQDMTDDITGEKVELKINIPTSTNEIKHGARFIDLRPQYAYDPWFEELFLLAHNNEVTLADLDKDNGPYYFDDKLNIVRDASGDPVTDYLGNYIMDYDTINDRGVELYTSTSGEMGWSADQTWRKTQKMYFHRFFGQADISMAYADYALFFGVKERKDPEIITVGPLTIDLAYTDDYSAYGIDNAYISAHAKLFNEDGTDWSDLGSGRKSGIGTPDHPLGDFSITQVFDYAYVGNINIGTKRSGFKNPHLKGNILLRNDITHIYSSPVVNKEGYILRNLGTDPGCMDLSLDMSGFMTDLSSNIITVEGQTTAKLPGIYGDVELASNSTLKLFTGHYYFNSFNTDPNVKINFDTTSGPIVIFVKNDFKIESGNKFVRTENLNEIIADASKILFVCGTEYQVCIGNGTEWHGTLLVPNATTTLLFNNTVLTDSLMLEVDDWIKRKKEALKIEDPVEQQEALDNLMLERSMSEWYSVMQNQGKGHGSFCSKNITLSQYSTIYHVPFDWDSL